MCECRYVKIRGNFLCDPNEYTPPIYCELVIEVLSLYVHRHSEKLLKFIVFHLFSILQITSKCMNTGKNLKQFRFESPLISSLILTPLLEVSALTVDTLSSFSGPLQTHESQRHAKYLRESRGHATCAVLSLTFSRSVSLKEPER